MRDIGHWFGPSVKLDVEIFSWIGRVGFFSRSMYSVSWIDTLGSIYYICLANFYFFHSKNVHYLLFYFIKCKIVRCSRKAFFVSTWLWEKGYLNQFKVQY